MSGYGSRLGRMGSATVLPWVVVAAVAAGLGTGLLVLAGSVSPGSTLPVPLIGAVVPTVAVAALGLFALALVVGLAVSRFDGVAFREFWTSLSLWVRAPVLGLGCALLAALTVAVLLDAGPVWAVVAFLAAWPLCTSGLVLRARRTREEGGLVAALVGSGYAQLRGPERRTLAVFAGGLLALLAGALTTLASQWLFGSASGALSVGIGAIVWPLTAVLVHARYAATVDAGGLHVRDIEAAEGRRELTLVNDSDRVIDLGGAHLRDTEHDRYRVGVDRELGPGQQCVIAVPESFSLAPDETAVSLPFGYTLERGSVLPVLFGRRGCRYELQRASTIESGTATGVTDDE